MIHLLCTEGVQLKEYDKTASPNDQSLYENVDTGYDLIICYVFFFIEIFLTA